MRTALDHDLAKKLAERLDQATMQKNPITRLTYHYPTMSVELAYKIQQAGIALRLDRGEKTIGYKMGLTSVAKQQQMRVNSPIFGVLTDLMQVQDHTNFSLQKSIHPKIEPEIAFVLDKDLAGNPSPDEALDACSHLSPAIEIIDSRYQNFSFLLPDVIADDCASSGFVIGNQQINPKNLDLSDLAMRLSVNNRIVKESSSHAVLGNPLNSVIALVQLLNKTNQKLPAGSIVLTGAATEAITLTPNINIALEIENLGSVNLNIIQ